MNSAPLREIIVCPEPVKPDTSDLDRAMAFYERLRSLQGPSVPEQLAAARQAFETDSSDLNRLQLAMVMTIGGTGVRNDDAIMELLLPMIADEKRDKSSLRAVANLLHSEATEHRRLGDTLRQQALKLKEENRRNDALQHKLDALLEMEKKIMERDLPPPETRK